MPQTSKTPFSLPAVPAYEIGNSHMMRNLILETGLLLQWYRSEKDAASVDIFFYVTLGLDSKEAYLEFRDKLKAWLRLFETSQKELKAKMHAPGGCSTSQMYASYSAGYITTLIDIRRASKVWAGKKMDEARVQAA
jgi:hypothetical protein